MILILFGENLILILAIFVIDVEYVLYVYVFELYNYKFSIKFFNGDNYKYWKRCVEVNFFIKRKFDLVKGKYFKLRDGDFILLYWERCNNVVIFWFLKYVELEILESIVYCLIV